jgi:hypothetical protein
VLLQNALSLMVAAVPRSGAKNINSAKQDKTRMVDNTGRAPFERPCRRVVATQGRSANAAGHEIEI